MMVMTVVCKEEKWVKGDTDFNYCARCCTHNAREHKEKFPVCLESG